MVTVEFQDDRLVIITFPGDVTAADVEQAWETFADPQFSADHDVIVDARTARIDFPVHAVPGIVSRRDRNLQGARGITCFVVESRLTRAAIGMVRDVVNREARWHFVRDFDEARTRIAERRSS